MNNGLGGQDKNEDAKLDVEDCVACILGMSWKTGINTFGPIREANGAKSESWGLALAREIALSSREVRAPGYRGKLVGLQDK
jgi:hypothetical protein